MKPKYLNFDSTNQNSFSIRRDRYPKYHNDWHYHEQIELVMINKGKGSLCIGGVIMDFNEGACVIIGENIPHFWLFHDLNSIENVFSIDCVVVHFSKNFAGNELFNIPELKNVKGLIELSQRGIYLNENTTKNIEDLCNTMLESDGVDRFTFLLKTLDTAYRLQGEYILNDAYSKLYIANDEKRMIDIVSYIRDNYTNRISLDDLADVARMTKNSFCRYFKQHTGKSLMQFINELRIAHACRLLRNTKMPLKEISYDSGFNNFVSFHKIFKKQMNTTPYTFKKVTTEILVD